MRRLIAAFAHLLVALSMTACLPAVIPATSQLPTRTSPVATRSVKFDPPPPPIAASATFTPLPTGTTKPTEVPRASATPTPPNIEDVLARCPSARDVNAVKMDLAITFESDPTAGILVCSVANGSVDLTRLQERAYQAVLMMKRIRFDAPLPWSNQSLYDWFVGTIKGIRFRADIDTSYCCEPRNTINIQTRNLAALTTNRWVDPKSSTGLLGLFTLLVHEARHNDGKLHSCNSGTDDRTLAEMGAWGVQYSLLYWMAYHGDPSFFAAPDPNPAWLRETMAANAFQIRQTRFCAEPSLTPGPMPPIKGR